MLAGANEISAGAVGLVYLAAVLPSLGVKLSAPYWCDTRQTFAGARHRVTLRSKSSMSAQQVNILPPERQLGSLVLYVQGPASCRTSLLAARVFVQPGTCCSARTGMRSTRLAALLWEVAAGEGVQTSVSAGLLHAGSLLCHTRPACGRARSSWPARSPLSRWAARAMRSWLVWRWHPCRCFSNLRFRQRFSSLVFAKSDGRRGSLLCLFRLSGAVDLPCHTRW